ncbi:MAG TPA: SusC/RagA family TonB-linked outer membrane protein [Longimicrobiaceae bacterium]|nr:SusC/RagA family TonB-linked outer membrane protein [Longimicrobiaceae bacterium]
MGLFLAPATMAAQQRTITGQVTDAATGRPLSGVQVFIPVGGEDVVARGAVNPTGRETSGTITNSSGNFSIEAPAGEVLLEIRLIGYLRETVTVAPGQNSVEVNLEVDVLNLEEIVVTGQATGVSRRNLANAVGTVDGEEMSDVPSASIETQLAAKVAGADVQSNSGAPGGGNQINLRGVSTIIGSSTPLYVIDGVIVSDRTINSGANSITGAGGGISNGQDQSANRIADLNPADIASVEILKGASAAAIYGSKANNGVIIITTKRGRAGETQYRFSQDFGVATLSNKLGTRQFETLEEAIARFGEDVADVYTNETFDLEEQLAGDPAFSRETSGSISGGTENTRFFVSGLAKNDDGIVNGTYYDKYSLRLNLSQSISDDVSLSLQTNALRTNTGRGFTGNDNTSTAYYVALTSIPSFIDLSRNEDGTFPFNPFAASNPLETAALAINDAEVSRFIGGLNLTWDALTTDNQTLRFVANGGTDYFSQKNVVYAPETLQFEDLSESPTDEFPGTSVVSNSGNININTGVNAVHTFRTDSGWLNATTSAGFQYEYRDLDIIRSRTQDLFAGQQNIGQGTFIESEETRSRSKDLGVFLQEEMLFGDRLLLTAGLRADRSSSNSDTDKWFYYPKFAGSYFFPLDAGILDDIKFRAAYGQAGNQPVYGQKFNNLNPGSIGGIQTLLLGNTTVADDLHPERQTEIEGGVDATLFNGRTRIELTAYTRTIDDILLRRDLAPSTGFGQALYNSDGQLSTTGYEAALTAVPFQSEDLDWTSRVVFSTDETIVESLDVPPFNYNGGGFGTSLGNIRIEEGKSVTQIVGRDTTTFVDDPRCLEALNVEPGSGRCAPGTRIVTQIGDANPDFRMGFSNDLRYKALTLSSTVDWQHGGDIINLLTLLFDLNQNAADYDDPCTFEDCQPGETKGDARARLGLGRTTTVFVEDGSFVKLREITLSLAIPTDLIGRYRLFSDISSMQLSLSGRNLLTWTDYTGFDPEVNQFGSQAIRANVDVGPYPPSRTFWLSLDVGF